MLRIPTLVVTVTLTGLLAPVADAQIGGKRPLRIVVASPPGGPSDTQARLLVSKLSEVMGQNVVVDNRPSNNGVVGADICAKAAPDGYTVCVGNSGTHAINATLYRKLPYDPENDFTAISQVTSTGMVVAVSPKLPAASLQDLQAYAKKNPGRVNIGIPGATGQLAGDALWSRLDVKMNNVNYKGSAPAELAVLSGEVDIAFLTPLASAQHIQSGRMKAFGITSPQRSPLLPNLPTVAESGVPGYEITFWNGVFGPAKLPPKFLQTVHGAIVQSLQVPETRDRILQVGFVPIGNTPAEFDRIVKAEIAKFRKLIRESGIPQL